MGRARLGGTAPLTSNDGQPGDHLRRSGSGTRCQPLRAPAFVDDEQEGVGPTDLLEPLAVLAVFFLAYVLGTASASYSAADDAAAAEANVVDNFFETTEYLAEPPKEALKASAVCYARAVPGPEWATMDRSGLSTIPSNWTGTKPHRIRRTFQQLGPGNNLFEKLTAADAERGDTRRERVRRASPSISPYVYGFMVATIVFRSPKLEALVRGQSRDR